MKRNVVPNQQKYLRILILIFSVIAITSLFFVQFVGKIYLNIQYGYIFIYPKEAQISFISSENNSVSLYSADTISVRFDGSESMRIQSYAPGQILSNDSSKIFSVLGKNKVYQIHNQFYPCNYLVEGKKSELCLNINRPSGYWKIDDTKSSFILKTLKFF